MELAASRRVSSQQIERLDISEQDGRGFNLVVVHDVHLIEYNRKQLIVGSRVGVVGR